MRESCGSDWWPRRSGKWQEHRLSQGPDTFTLHDTADEAQGEGAA